MRVFVLCTGRCGSTTFGAAVAHCTNFTSGQESQNDRIGPTRLTYPDQHIEIDNRLSWILGKLDQTFGDTAHYVHLQRDPQVVARSFASRHKYGLMKAYREGVLSKHHNRHPQTPVIEVATELVDTITTNIHAFLKDKTKVMAVHVETMERDFPRFWHWIGASGDLNAAMAEWTVRHNATKPA
ncbi:MAG: hypothetical protein ABI832_21670 [bacterium]